VNGETVPTPPKGVVATQKTQGGTTNRKWQEKTTEASVDDRKRSRALLTTGKKRKKNKPYQLIHLGDTEKQGGPKEKKGRNQRFGDNGRGKVGGPSNTKRAKRGHDGRNSRT